MVAQELQLLYARSHDLADASSRLWRILDRCARSDVPDSCASPGPLDAWSEELLAYWTSTGRRGVSNGPTEATNALIKKVKRSDTASATSTTTAYGCCSPSVDWTGEPSTGRLRLPPRSEDAHHPWWRRAVLSRHKSRQSALPRTRPEQESSRVPRQSHSRTIVDRRPAQPEGGGCLQPSSHSSFCDALTASAKAAPLTSNPTRLATAAARIIAWRVGRPS
jgi:hypothetical protein